MKRFVLSVMCALLFVAPAFAQPGGSTQTPDVISVRLRNWRHDFDPSSTTAKHTVCLDADWVSRENPQNDKVYLCPSTAAWGNNDIARVVEDPYSLSMLTVPQESDTMLYGGGPFEGTLETTYTDTLDWTSYDNAQLYVTACWRTSSGGEIPNMPDGADRDDWASEILSAAWDDGTGFDITKAEPTTGSATFYDEDTITVKFENVDYAFNGNHWSGHHHVVILATPIYWNSPSNTYVADIAKRARLATTNEISLGGFTEGLQWFMGANIETDFWDPFPTPERIEFTVAVIRDADDAVACEGMSDVVISLE